MKYRVKLNDKVYEVEVEQGEAQLLKEYDAVSAPAAPVASPAAPAPVAAAAAPASAPAAAPAAPAGAGETVKSPLPGSVVDVKITVGQKVKRGEVVMLIEAMKMENEISAPKDGTIVSVMVSKGSKVEDGTPIYVIG